VGPHGTQRPGPDGARADDRARKSALRRATRAARDGLQPDQRARASAAVVDRLRRLPELRRARVVALYAAHGSEVDVGALIAPLRARGVTTVLPRVDGDELRFVTTTADSRLAIGYRGVSEPHGPTIELGTIDAIVLPGLAFDPVGGRLGQGGGHYDRLLSEVRPDALRIGVGHACQIVPRVPREAHDGPVDVVVTDRATYRTRART
jgi:5-formyltetrahydrofolate cyclo-ligase